MGYSCDVGDRVLYTASEHKDLWNHLIFGAMWGTLISSEGRGDNKRFICKFDDKTERVLLGDDAYRHRNDDNPLEEEVNSDHSDVDRVQNQIDDDEVSNEANQESASEKDAPNSSSEEENMDQRSAAAELTRKLPAKVPRTCSKCGKQGHDARTCKEGEAVAESSAQGAARGGKRPKRTSTAIAGIAGVQLFFRRCPRRGCAARLVCKRSLIKDGPLQGARPLPTRLQRPLLLSKLAEQVELRKIGSKTHRRPRLHRGRHRLQARVSTIFTRVASNPT